MSDQAEPVPAAEQIAAELVALRSRVALAESLLGIPAVIERADAGRQYLIVLDESEWAAWTGVTP